MTVLLFYVLPFIVVNSIIFILVTAAPKGDLTIGEATNFTTTTMELKIKSLLPIKEMTVTLDGGAVVTVQGNTCPRGAEYAKSEATAPVRTVTSTVRALGGVRPVVAVKTVPDVPKGKIFAVMDAVRALEVKAPVHIGDILCENIADTGSNLVAAADLDAE